MAWSQGTCRNGTNANEANPAAVQVINHVYFRLQRGAYVSERDHDGDGDGAEEQDHAQGEQDTLAGRDVNLGHINTLSGLWRDLRRTAACVAPPSPCSGS